VTSQLAWLDFDAEQQRRTREMLRLFEEKESRDELGIGQVRDAFSDLMFPGMSVLLTRARYFLLVPWCAAVADRTARQRRPQSLADVERRVVLTLLAEAPDDFGIIGARAGAKVKNLPSVIYNQALERYGIARSASDDRTALEEELGEEVTRRATGRWVSSVPPAPPGFPDSIVGGLRLETDEARWLTEQIVSACPTSFLAHVLQSAEPIDDVPWAWSHPAVRHADDETRAVVEDAELFSLAMHGAALLYNLLIAEKYEAAGLTYVVEPVDRYRNLIGEWADTLSDHSQLPFWDTATMWARVIGQNPRIQGNPRARLFISTWLAALSDLTEVADRADLRALVREREVSIKGPQSRLRNDKLLRTWAGASGSRRLDFRWPNVRTIVADIHAGAEDLDARA
jgi:hypothetical protein